jgi:hypothetical protein
VLLVAASVLLTLLARRKDRGVASGLRRGHPARRGGPALGPTFYARFGDAPVLLLFGLLVFCATLYRAE